MTRHLLEILRPLFPRRGATTLVATAAFCLQILALTTLLPTPEAWPVGCLALCGTNGDCTDSGCPLCWSCDSTCRACSVADQTECETNTPPCQYTPGVGCDAYVGVPEFPKSLAFLFGAGALGAALFFLNRRRNLRAQ